MPSFFVPTLGDLTARDSRVPTPGNLPSKAKKMPMPGGQPGGGWGGGWAEVGLIDALQIRFFSFAIFFYPLFTLYRTVNHTGQGFCSYIRAVILAQFSSVTKRTLRHSDLESVPHAGAV